MLWPIRLQALLKAGTRQHAEAQFGVGSVTEVVLSCGSIGVTVHFAQARVCSRTFYLLPPVLSAFDDPGGLANTVQPSHPCLCPGSY